MKLEKIIYIFIILLTAILLFGCTTNKESNDINFSNDNNKLDSNLHNGGYSNLGLEKKVKIGDSIEVHYILSIKDGNKLIPYQSSYDSKIPMSIIVGKTSLIKGFEDALIGMKVGEMKTIILPPEQAYGAKENGQVMVFDSNRFEDFNKVQVGAIFDMGGGSVAEIIEKRDTNARALVYPKLAGQTLVFVIELVSIK